MSALQIEERIAVLEQEIARIKAHVGASNKYDSWLDRIYGAFENNAAFKEAMDLGRKYRESLVPKAPRGSKKK